jgi:hypothetical protein
MKEPAALQPKWPEGLEQGVLYEFPCDDKGMNGKCMMRVFVANDGDVHLSAFEQMEPRVKDHDGTVLGPIYNNFPSVRCRTGAGGGQHRRTRQALLWLADAIRRDNEELANKYGKPKIEGV